MLFLSSSCAYLPSRHRRDVAMGASACTCAACDLVLRSLPGLMPCWCVGTRIRIRSADVRRITPKECDGRCRCNVLLYHVMLCDPMPCLQAFVSCLCSRCELQNFWCRRCARVWVLDVALMLPCRCIMSMHSQSYQTHSACRRCRARPQPWASFVADVVRWSLAVIVLVSDEIRPIG